jgi:riboflavin biosynthesis pyrimidine reductase
MAGAGWKETVALPKTVRLVWHESEPYPHDVALDDLYRGLLFPPAAGPIPYLIANMVMTQNGEATVGGVASTIGTPVDSLLLVRLRTHADAVLYGSGTLVAEDVTAGLPEAEAARRAAAGRYPKLLAVLLASRLAWDKAVFSRRFFTDDRFDKLIITADRAAPEDVRRLEASGIEVARVPADRDGHPDPTAALRLLASRKIHLIVAEGGPRMLASLLRAEIVRELFLTTSPLATGDPHAPRPIGGDVTRADRPLLFARVSRLEFSFTDPGTGAHLVEAYDRFRIVYPT